MSFASTSKAGSGWTPEDDQILVDATLRNQRASAITSLLPGRTTGAINGRITKLKKPHEREGVERKMLPRDWTVKQKTRMPTYRFEEDEELVRWRCNNCIGLRGEIFDDSRSKKLLRRRIAELEKESENLSGSVVEEIVRLEKEHPATYPAQKWDSISASINRPISASLCMAAWHFVANRGDRIDNPLYQPFRPSGPSRQYVETEGPPETPAGSIRNDPNLARRLRLNLTNEEKERHIDGIPKVRLKRWPSTATYPPKGEWVCANAAIGHLWDNTDEMNDKGLHDLNREKLQHIVKPGESVQIHDEENGKLVAVIQRGFVPDPGVLKSLNGIAERNCRVRDSVRRKDPGTIVLTGYTAGSMHQRSFGWACNVIPELKKEEEIQELNYTTSSAYALFWNMLRNSVPYSLIKDTNMIIEKNGLPRMDSNRKGRVQIVDTRLRRVVACSKSLLGSSLLQVAFALPTTQGEQAHPQPQSLESKHLVRRTHSERNASDNVLSLTTHRSRDTKGGNFYNSSYGFLIESKPNTLVTHRAKDFHGTTLAQVTPGIEEMYQIGMSILIAKGLPGAWHKYENGLNANVTEALDFDMATEEEQEEEQEDKDDIKMGEGD